MNNTPNQSVQQPLRRSLRFTYVILALSLVLLVIAFTYGAWTHNSEHEAALPVPALEQIVLALRTFHHQTGRFPKDFHELDKRVWKGARAEQISTDGNTLIAPASHYCYTLHTLNPPDAVRATLPAKAGIWAVPTGERVTEAAAYFWYITPQKIEGWMGPALTRENVGAVKAIPSEQQLALLTMTRQPSNGVSLTAPKSKGIFSFFP